MTSRKLFLSCIAVVLIASGTRVSGTELEGESANWTSYSDAVERSKLSGRPIMLVFSGSDWCGWCRRLSHEVFPTAEFAQWSSGRVELVEVDFPKSHELPADVSEVNQGLADKFRAHVKSYPTVLFVNSDLEVLGKVGYVSGGSKAWITQASQHLSSDDVIVQN